MPISNDYIQPVTTANSAPVLKTEETPIPKSVLQIPEVSALLQGSPPALIFSIEDFKSPEAQTIWSNRDALLKAGLGLYGLQDKSGGVVFNARFISPEEIRLADQKGKIEVLATPFGELRSALGTETPASNAAPTSEAIAPAQPAVAPASSQAQGRIATARTKNLAVGSPTSGPVPGQGRILNNILKPTV